MPQYIIYGEQMELPVYVHMPAWLIQSELTAEERMVYTVIYNRAYLYSIRNARDYVNAYNQVYVIYTNEGLARDSGLKMGKLKKAKAGLIAKHFIRIEKIQKSYNIRIYPLFPIGAKTYKYKVKSPKKCEGYSEDYQAQSFNVDDFFAAAMEKTESEI